MKEWGITLLFGVLVVTGIALFAQPTNPPSLPQATGAITSVISNLTVREMLITDGEFWLPGYGYCMGTYLLSWPGEKTNIYIIEMQVNPAWQWSAIGKYEDSSAMQWTYPMIKATGININIPAYRQFRVLQLTQTNSVVP